MEVAKIYIFTLLIGTITASVAVILPLYLLSKNYSSLEIGIILSFLPLIHSIVRIIFASIADVFGLRKMFFLSAFFSLLSNFFYAFSSTPSIVAIGKINEALSSSSFWAVSRTMVYKKVKDKKSGAVILKIFSRISKPLGNFLGGILAQIVGFFFSFISLFFLSIFSVLPILTLKEKIPKTKLKLSKVLKRIKILKLWKFGSILSIEIIPSQILPTLILPIYLSKLGFNSSWVGIVIATYSIFTTFSMLLLKVSRKKLFFLSLILSSSLFFSFPSLFLIPLFIFALGSGIRQIFFEGLIIKGSEGSKYVSTDIGILHLPVRIVNFVGYILFGFLLSTIGSYLVFCLLSFFAIVFTILAYFFEK